MIRIHPQFGAMPNRIRPAHFLGRIPPTQTAQKRRLYGRYGSSPGLPTQRQKQAEIILYLLDNPWARHW